MADRVPTGNDGGGQVLAALDASLYTRGVCRYAAWAAGRMAAPLTLLHVVEGRAARGSGQGEGFADVDFDPGAALLDEAGLLEAAGALEGEARGRLLLQQCAAAVAQAQACPVRPRLGRGALSDAFTAMAPEAALFVMGRRGEHSEFGNARMGSQVERVVRNTGRPLLVASRGFRDVRRVLVASDGSDGARGRLEWVARSPLLAGLEIRVVTVGDESARPALDQALQLLADAGVQAAGRVVHGDPQEMIAVHAEAVRADLLVMGAYGHSRIHQLLLGSTTSTLLRTSRIPLLLLR